MNLRDRVRFLSTVTAEETAAEEFLGNYDPSDARDVEIAYYMLCLQRANAFLDKRKEEVFQTVLALSNRGQVERARLAYDEANLYGLGLSLEATAELAQELILLAQRYNLPAPKAWLDVAAFNSGPQVQPLANTYPRKVVDL